MGNVKCDKNQSSFLELEKEALGYLNIYEVRKSKQKQNKRVLRSYEAPHTFYISNSILLNSVKTVRKRKYLANLYITEM